MRSTRCLPFFLLAGMAAFFGQAHAQFGSGHEVQKIEAVVSTDGVHAGTVIHTAIQVELKRGYHVNSNKPHESFLIKTVMSLDLPEGFRLIETVYPEAFELVTAASETPLAVYEESFTIGVAIQTPETLSEGEHIIKGTLRYQACDDKACYAPKNLDTEIKLKVVAANSELSPTHVEIFEGITFGEWDLALPAGSEGSDTKMEDPAESPVDEDVGVLALLDDFEVLGSTGGFMGASKFIAFIDGAESGAPRTGWFEGKGPIAIIALILAGGLALNLTPCVLPMIPINLAIIGAGAQAGSRARGFALGGTYGLAMAAVYGVLGLVVILTAGTFGTINSYWQFNLGIAILFVVLALAMFDVIAIDFSKFQSKFNIAEKGKGTFYVAFGMGAVAALLAGACVAPVVIQVIVFSSELYTGGTKLALALPFLLGLGMALPWPFAGGGLSLLPKPGAWMVRVKHVFGVFIFGFAAYYGWQAYELGTANWVDDTEVASSVQEMLDEGWYSSMADGLEAAKAEDKLVLVDMWATWCKNCLTMDKTTFKDESVLARLDDYVKIKFQAQNPEDSPAKEVMERFQGIGLPTYAVLRAK